MAGGVTLTVRQIASYPLISTAGGGLLLMQPGGLGNPYVSVTAEALVASALNDAGPIGIGFPPPPGAFNAQVFAQNYVSAQNGAHLFNCSFTTGDEITAWVGGNVGVFDMPSAGYFAWQLGAGGAGQPVTLSQVMTLSMAGALSLPQGTLTVARDPASAMEVATMGWVGANTVATFNGRRGAVTLNGCDIYSALCISSTLATEDWVNAQIQASTQYLLANHPFVFGWNGRVGAVWLTLADISCVFMQPGQQPITQTPPLTSNDYSIPNTAWVVNYIQTEIGGSGTTLATQSWVLANTVNSFNGRQGPVTLTSADVYDVGAAPLNSPQFSGIPTAPTANVGTSTGQVATTAFVQAAIADSTAGVASWNGRTGVVTMTAADISAAGGLANPSPNLTGAPTAPTAALGTSTPQIASTQFVMNELAAGTVSSFNTRVGAVTLTLADVTGVGGAPIISPAFSNVPTAPTAAPGTNTPQLATTAFVTAAVGAAGGVSSFNSRTGAVVLEANDVSAVGGLINPSVGLTGVPTAPTATAGTNTNQLATTAFVTTAISSGAVSSFNTRTGAVTLSASDITGAGGALLASPALTGTPTAPTATAGTNNTQIATTAFVIAAIASGTAGVSSFNGRQGAVTLTTADVTGAGGAPIASPSLTGTPLAPTATPGTATTQIATTAFVMAALAASGVTSFNSRTGAVTLQANDLSAVGGALLASPAFTGTPTAPTPAAGNSSTNIATTAFVAGALGSYLPLTGGTLQTPNGLTLAATGGAQTPFSVSLNGTVSMSISGAGGITAAASSIGNVGLSGGSVTAAGSVAVGAGPNLTNSFSMYIQAGSGLPVLNFYSGWTYWVNTANGFNWSSPTQPQAMQLVGSNGNLWIAGTYNTTSDASAKTNISPLAQGISLVRQLIPKSFAFNSEPDITHWGFVAQDVESVIPAAVSEGPSGLLGLDLTAIVAALTYALKQLDQRCSALEATANITPPAAEVA